MEWTDQGILLSARRHGESAAIVSLLTPDHGRHAGLVPGGGSRRQRATLQPGNLLQATWRARLAEHLGYMTCELMEGWAADLLDDDLRLAALTAALALVDAALPEREPHRRIYDGLGGLIATLRGGAPLESWGAAFARFEAAVLADLGYGLDLASCAATGATAELAFVSPKTGRAVSAAAAAPYRERLLALPSFLLVGADPDAPVGRADLLAGLKLTGYFLEQNVFSHLPGFGGRAAGQAGERRGLPPARDRLLDKLARRAA
ncbi:MAG TPA: DNA repair protein RecO [Dongiaceae bacterium]|jgi:DNA repair protein RecO (recombination protein O)